MQVASVSERALAEMSDRFVDYQGTRVPIALKANYRLSSADTTAVLCSILMPVVWVRRAAHLFVDLIVTPCPIRNQTRVILCQVSPEIHLAENSVQVYILEEI